jgi:hypothetical protein
MNERKTEKLVRDALAALGYESRKDVTIEEQKSDNPKIAKLLKTASKAGNGAGSPEFIITSAQHPDLIVVIECKASTKNHRSKNLDQPKDFACDGALLYPWSWQRKSTTASALRRIDSSTRRMAAKLIGAWMASWCHRAATFPAGLKRSSHENFF